MNRYTIIYISLLIVLCSISFRLGKREVKVSECVTQLIVDTIYVDSPPPPADTIFISHVAKKLPIVDYKELEQRILDSLTESKHKRPNILLDSVVVNIPIKQYKFEKEGLYEIGISGYNTSLDYAKIFSKSTTTTLHSPIKHWRISSGIDAIICNNQAEATLTLGVEYSIDKWNISGGYSLSTNCRSGYFVGIQRTLFKF